MIGSWNANDLPEAVPVLITTSRPEWANSAASIWWDHAAVIPRSRRASSRSVPTQGGHSRDSARRAGISVTWRSEARTAPSASPHTAASNSLPKLTTPSPLVRPALSLTHELSPILS